MYGIYNFPNKDTWRERRKFIDEEIATRNVAECYMVNDHASALFFELQNCYCVGAWLSVVILSVSIIDAHIRYCEGEAEKLETYKLLKKYYQGDDINWLRKLRNSYVHFDENRSTLEMNILYTKVPKLSNEATRALKIVVSVLFRY
ncbi:MAG: hypothetical protein EOP00_04885 [Pedobacter sp.]|nr:MAG: hypothetical protein EOP00_04885 [Pedobacter sp.]